MKNFWRFFTLPVAVSILELLPWGAVLNFARPDGGAYRRTYSYFSMVPFGYANFAPLITAILTCILMMMTIAYTVKPSICPIGRMTTVSGIAAVLSLAPLLYGIKSFSIVGALISVGLLLHTALLMRLRKENDKTTER